MEADEGDLNHMSQMAVLRKQISVKGGLKKVKKDQYSLMAGLQLTQKERERVKGELEEKNVLIESLRETSKTERSDLERQRREPGEVTERQRYEIRG